MTRWPDFFENIFKLILLSMGHHDTTLTFDYQVQIPQSRQEI